MCKDNFFLDEFRVTGFPALPKGKVELEVTFDMNINGILTVSVIDNITKKKTNITVNKGECELKRSF